MHLVSKYCPISNIFHEIHESPGLFQFIQRIDPCLPQILIFFIVSRIVLFDIGLVEDFGSLNHTHRLLINPLRDGSGKAMKQGTILEIIF
jgi:hypothetical protein